MKESEAKKKLLKMGIKSENGFIYFNELLYRLMREQYVTDKFTLDTKMTIIELTTQFKLYNLTLKAKGGSMKNNQKGHEFVTFIKAQETSVNPLMTQIFLKISFNMWHHYTLRVQRGERNMGIDLHD